MSPKPAKESMRISHIEAQEIIQIIAQSSSFITRQLLKLLATSTEVLEFPFPYDNIRMNPTNKRDKFILCYLNDSSEEGELQLEELVKRLRKNELTKHFI